MAADGNALRSILAVFGFKVEDKELKSADKNIESFLSKVNVVGKALIGGAIAVGIFRFGQSLAETGDHLRDTSIRLGISTDAVQELGFAAEQSGAGVENLSTALLILQDKVGDALINSGGEGAKSFAKYGIAIRDAAGHVKDADQLFAEVADKIAGTTDEAKKVTIATDLFGRQGRVLLPLLKEGAKGIEALRLEARELGEGFSKEATEASDDFNDSLGRFNRVVQTARGRIATLLLPVLKRVVDIATKAGAIFLQLAKNSSIVQTVLGALGVVLTAFAIKAAIAFAPFIAGGLAIAALIALVEDFVTMLRGGKSVIGDTIDKMFGKDAHLEVVKELKKDWEDLKNTFSQIGEVIKPIWEFFKWLAEGGDQLGDILGKIGVNADINRAEFAGQLKRGRGGNTFDTNTAIEQAKLLLQAQERGQKFTPTTVPAFYKGREQEFLKVVQQWADYMRPGRQQQQQGQIGMGLGMLTGLSPAALTASPVGGNVTNSLELNVTVPPGTMQEQADFIGRTVRTEWQEMTRGVDNFVSVVPK